MLGVDIENERQGSLEAIYLRTSQSADSLDKTSIAQGAYLIAVDGGFLCQAISGAGRHGHEEGMILSSILPAGNRNDDCQLQIILMTAVDYDHWPGFS